MNKKTLRRYGQDIFFTPFGCVQFRVFDPLSLKCGVTNLGQNPRNVSGRGSEEAQGGLECTVH